MHPSRWLGVSFATVTPCPLERTVDSGQLKLVSAGNRQLHQILHPPVARGSLPLTEISQNCHFEAHKGPGLLMGCFVVVFVQTRLASLNFLGQIPLKGRRRQLCVQKCAAVLKKGWKKQTGKRLQ